MARKSFKARPKDLQMAVVAAPDEAVSLTEELRLLKPALLYGDGATLISPKAAMIMGMVNLETLSIIEIMDLILYLSPVIAPEKTQSIATVKQEYTRLKRKKGITKDELLICLQIESFLRSLWSEHFQPYLEALTVQTGADKLKVAIKAGLLKVDGLKSPNRGLKFGLSEGSEERDYSDDLMDGWLSNVLATFSEPKLYPILDSVTGKLISQGVSEGVFEIPAHGEGRQTHAHVAASIIDRLPAFDGAGIDDIVDIREELTTPLVRFRSAVAELSKVSVAPSDALAFEAQVQEIQITKILPAVLEIEERIAESSYMRELLVSPGAASGALFGGAITAALSNRDGILGFLSDVTGGLTGSDAVRLAGGAATAGIAAKWAIDAAAAKSRDRREIEKHELFFVYKAGQLLTKRQFGTS